MGWGGPKEHRKTGNRGSVVTRTKRERGMVGPAVSTKIVCNTRGSEDGGEKPSLTEKNGGGSGGLAEKGNFAYREIVDEKTGEKTLSKKTHD